MQLPLEKNLLRETGLIVRTSGCRDEENEV